MFDFLKNDIAKDLALLEDTSLVLLDKIKYLDFKNKLLDVRRRLEEYETDMIRKGIRLDYNLPQDIKVDYAFVSAKLEFFLKYGDGYKNIFDYQADLIRDNLKKVMVKLNAGNFLVVNTELDELLELYERNFKKAMAMDDIEELITKFKYQVLKYGIEQGIYDGEVKVSSLITLVLDDIEVLLKKQDVPLWLRNDLQKYTVDVRLIEDNFREIMILIVLGLTKKNITLEEGKRELNKKYYRQKDFKKEYKEPTNEIKLKVQEISNGDLERKYYGEALKLYLPIVLELNDWSLDNLDVVMMTLRKDNKLSFEMIAYLAEAMIVKFGYFQKFQGMDKFLKLRSFFLEHDIFGDAFDIAILRYGNDISGEVLGHYALLVRNEFWFNLIIKMDKEDFFTKELRDFAINNNNIPLIEACFKKNMFQEEDIWRLPNDYKVRYLENILKDANSDLEKQNLLLKWYFKFKDDQMLDYIIMKILDFADFNLLIRFLNGIGAVTRYFEKNDKFFEVILRIKDKDLREQVINYYWEEINKNPYYERKFINEELIARKKQNVKIIFQAHDLEKMNMFEAMYVSSFVDKRWIKEFVTMFKDLKLDYEYLLRESADLDIAEKGNLLKIGYLHDKDTFFRNVRVTSDIAKEMVGLIPSSLNDFIKYMQIGDIVALRGEALELFAEDYERELQQNNIDLKAMLIPILTKGKHKEKVSFFTYVMHRGLFTPEMLKSCFNLFIHDWERTSGKSTYFDFVPSLIRKAPGYLRPALMRPFIIRNLNEELDWDMLFVSATEWAMIDDDSRDLKKKKYCGDLLKLLEVVPIEIKMNIIKIIAGSGVLEYINYLLNSYGEYRNLILAEVQDEDIYEQLRGGGRSK